MDGFIGEIRAFGFNYAPEGWALCNGQAMSVEHALFSVIGTRFGGDGETTFNLPNLQGRVAIGAGGVDIPDNAIQPTGSATPASHGNRPLYLVTNMCICLEGAFPARG